MMSTEYLAGFFDGEGSVGVYAIPVRNHSYCLRAQITQVRTLETECLLREMAEILVVQCRRTTNNCVGTLFVGRPAAIMQPRF